jgi:hypothetical protein
VELSQHFFLDRSLIGFETFDFVPQLDFDWFAERCFNFGLVEHVKLEEGGLADVKLLQIDLVQKNVQGPQTPGFVSSDELCLVVLVEQSEFQEESLRLTLNVLDKVLSTLQEQLDEIEAENVLGSLHLLLTERTHPDLCGEAN